uniref:Uncharacterized protein n=1 Tax=Anguilla anguilla TaxID=7936 RepID=A0A0E9WZ96_ANGAN
MFKKIYIIHICTDIVKFVKFLHFFLLYLLFIFMWDYFEDCLSFHLPSLHRS